MYGHPNHKPANQANSIAVAACSFSITSSGEIQLTPAGHFSARDGRPLEVDSWVVDDQTAPLILAALKAKTDRIVIDYEHQTLNAEKNGQPAPAAGWFNGVDVVYRSGEGLFVTPEWTAAAKAHIDGKEYQYFSPVMKYNKNTGAVTSIEMGALTNYAAIDGMKEIEALAAARFDINQTEDNSMNEAQLALLGLKKDASDADITAALTALTDKDKQSDEAIAAAKAETPADTLTVMKGMQTELSALTAKLNGKELDDLMVAALSDGRLLKPLEDWARKLGQSNIASLKAYLDGTAPIAALKGTQTEGKEPAGSEGSGNLDVEDLAVCKSLGIDPDDYAKTKAEAA